MTFVRLRFPVLRRRPLYAAVGLFLVLLGQGVQAQSRLVSDVDRRAGPPGTFQKPIAADIADHTVLLEGIAFGGTQYLYDDLMTAGLVPDTGEGMAFFYGGVFDLRIVRKMANTYSYGFDGRLLVNGAEGSYDNDTRYDVFVAGHRGKFSYGNFADRNAIALSPRATLSGEANLFYDGYFGPSTRRAFRYRGRFSSFLVDMAVDDDGDTYNAGFLYRSPSRTKKDSWALHYNGGDFLDRYDRDGLMAGYLVSYGSFDFLANVAWDQFDPYAGQETFDRYSASLGASYKFGATTLSAGVLFAETNGGELETGYTAGLRHDLARGLSWNAGWIYIDSESTGTDGLPVTAGEFSGFRTSVAYRF